MDELIQFFMDQHFPAPVSRALRRHGVDVLTAQEADRCGASDEDQLTFATEQDRVLVSFDTDFLELNHAGIEHSGIAWSPQEKYSFGELTQALLLVHGVLDRESMRNRVEYL